MRILIAEDETIIRLDLRELLEKSGFEVAPFLIIGLIGSTPATPDDRGRFAQQIAATIEAEAGDPFTAVRVIDLLARIERGRPTRLADIADRLNATYLDWLFPFDAILAVAVQHHEHP